MEKNNIILRFMYDRQMFIDMIIFECKDLFLKREEKMKIEKVIDNKENYLELLLEADPEVDVVKQYLNCGDMYILLDEEKVASIAIVIKVNDEECELKNIATDKTCRGKGFAGELIKYIFEEYKDEFKRMIVGTTENMIPFYVLNGFTKYHHTVKNFFVDNYEEEIWDGDLHCIDMYYYYKNL